MPSRRTSTMCSTRKLRRSMTIVVCIGAAAAAAAGIGGCQRLGNTPPEQLNPTPLVVDEAMQRRDWQPPQPATYENMSVVARPTGVKWTTADDMPERRRVLADPALWV